MPAIALLLFALAAVGGLFLAVRHFRGAELLLPVSLVHGAAGAIGLVLLLIAFLRAADGGPSVATPLLILVVAALGGFFLFSFHLRARRAPSAALVIHALVAVAGVLTLVAAVF